MNPFLIIVLFLGLSLGIFAGKKHKAHALALEEKAQTLDVNEVKATSLDGLDDDSKDNLLNFILEE